MSFTTAKTAPLWWEAVDARPTRQTLEHDIDVDVLIVGAGMTGLWTAYYLAAADPSLSIAVIEQRHVGFGASGRNGGWCHAEYPLGVETLARDHGHDEAARKRRRADDCEERAPACPSERSGRGASCRGSW